MSRSADLVYTGGFVFTTLGSAPERLAVAVTDGRITAVSPEQDIAPHVGPRTRIIDLAGGLLVPGFQDAHIHPVGGGIELLQCNLTEAADAEGALATIEAYARATPEADWIQGGGWSMDHFSGGAPTRQALDAVVPDRPVLLANRDHHGVWANTRAIELAGISASTPDPADGRIEREADGFPAGTFQEGAAELFAEVRPAISDELAVQGLLRAQQELFALGITGWQDAMIGNEMGIPDSLEIYARAVETGDLKAHVVGAQWWSRDQGAEQIESLIARREAIASRTPGEQFNLNTVKIMVDGVAENFTAAMNAPYRDQHGHDTDNAGLSFIDSELLKSYVTALDAAGFQVHFHALGDRAVREACDAIEEAREANGASDNRHHLAHLQLVDPVEIARFAPLGVAANIQALWACHETQLDTLTLPFLADDAEDHHYPFGELHQAGAKLVAGSDWPVSSPDPIAAIHVAVNRVSPESDEAPLGPEVQKLDLATALTAYTAGSAWVNHREHDTGAIAEGYLANLVVLEPNPFDVESSKIYTATVTSTWIQGVDVYTRTP